MINFTTRCYMCATFFYIFLSYNRLYCIVCKAWATICEPTWWEKKIVLFSKTARKNVLETWFLTRIFIFLAIDIFIINIYREFCLVELILSKSSTPTCFFFSIFSFFIINSAYFWFVLRTYASNYIYIYHCSVTVAFFFPPQPMMMITVKAKIYKNKNYYVQRRRQRVKIVYTKIVKKKLPGWLDFKKKETSFVAVC